MCEGVCCWPSSDLSGVYSPSTPHESDYNQKTNGRAVVFTAAVKVTDVLRRRLGLYSSDKMARRRGNWVHLDD